ncbi:MAG: flagellar FlbD family protein [Chloroflexota bacterium]
MITVSRLDGTELVINAELIEFIETTPDSVITLVDGKKLVVLESAQKIVERVMDYRNRAYAVSRPPVIVPRQDPEQE